MSITPIITFKAGICDLDTNVTPPKVLPKPTPGFIYLWEEDDLIRFCWRPRSASSSQPELELIMVPCDGTFAPYERSRPDATSKPPTNGRIYVLKFRSSSQRHLFWLQSKSQHAQGDPSWFSPRDLKWGKIVDELLQGQRVDVSGELANTSENPGGPGDDNDETMEDAEGASGDAERHQGGSGGAGVDATGGDIREEGEASREGGADGGRAAPAPSDDAAVAVQNFLRSLQGSGAMDAPNEAASQFATLPDLLPSSSTIPVIESADVAFVNTLLSYIPLTLLLLAQEVDDVSSVEPTPETASAAMEALTLEQKKEILIKVLRSPQFSQSLSSLTLALRDGGLPSISDALGIEIENGGFVRRSGQPVGGGQAIEAFLNGIRAAVAKKKEGSDGKMNIN
ncbi:hypothetical protein MMC12_004469 [Toensbergia leucococca]|nr:hypothetical protein [Toensbergia leucococca]